MRCSLPPAGRGGQKVLTYRRPKGRKKILKLNQSEKRKEEDETRGLFPMQIGRAHHACRLTVSRTPRNSERAGGISQQSYDTGGRERRG